MIETRLLYYFLTVANTGGFTRAAEYLGVSQSTLSKQLGDLEKAIGKQLFIRGKRHVTLTPDGVYLRSRAMQILEMVNQTQLVLTAEEDFLEGDIRLGCGELSVPDLALDAFRSLRAAHPRCRLHVHTESAEAITRMLDEELLDMALIFEPTTHTSFRCIPLPVQDDWGLLLPPECPLAKKEQVTFDDLRSVPLIYPKRIYDNRQHPAGFTLDNSELNIAVTYTQIHTAVAMLHRGMGCAYCLRAEAEAEGTEGFIFRPLTPKFPATLYIVLQKNAVLPPAAKLYLEKLLETKN